MKDNNEPTPPPVEPFMDLGAPPANVVDAGMIQLDDPNGDMLEARIHHGVSMRLLIEVEDWLDQRGDVVRTSFMPTKAQAETLGTFLLLWARKQP